MVLLGKALKGRTTQKGENTEKRNVRLREVMVSEQEYEAGKKMTETKEKHFANQVQTEEQIYNVNKKKLMANWRKILRIAKTEELKKELEVYSQLNQRELDSLEAYMQMLDKNIEEAEDQYNLALRNHLMQIEKLADIRNTRTDSLSQEFDRAIKILENEFETEAQEIERTHHRHKKELEDLRETIDQEEKEKQTLAAENFQAQTELVKQKAKEELEQMEGEMSSRQNNLSSELETLFQRYSNDTKDRFNKYLDLVEKNNTAEKTNNTTTKKIARTKDRIDLMDMKIRQMEQELKQKNSSLQREKDQVGKNFLNLKNKMLSFRDSERRKLTQLVLNSKMAMDKLDEVNKLGEKILKTSELCRRLETEKEKVIPFYDSTVTEEDIPADLAVLYREVSEQETRSYSYIKNYFKRYNKVMLDKIAIQQQKDLYKKENQTLKSLLKQYIDNISINDDVMAQENALMVTDKARMEMVPVERITASTIGRGGFVEGVEEADKLRRQHQ